MNLDLWIFYAINHAPHSAALDFVALVLHYATRGASIYYPLFALLLFSKDERTRLLGIVAAISAALTYITTDLILKYVVQRGRPFQELADAIFAAPAPANSSFPSGQAAVAFAVATTWFLFFPKKFSSYGFLVFAVFVALDRIYMGHHYPSDVLAGALVGILWSFFAAYLGKAGRDRAILN